MSELRPVEDDELMADWRRIRAGTASVQRRLDHAVEAEGVPAQWFAVLHMLMGAPEQGLPMTVLARDLAMTSGGFTKLADRMAKDGLLDRRGNAADRRVVHAALTEQGRDAALRAQRVYVTTLRDSLLSHVGRAELAAAGGTLDTLARAHSDVVAPGAGALHAGPFDADALNAEALNDLALVTTQRDPALPDRRGRGRVSE